MIHIKAKYSEALFSKASAALEVLKSGKGRGNDFLGWKEYPAEFDWSLLDQFEQIRSLWKRLGVEYVVVIGIGGSYLGAKASIEALKNPFGTAEDEGEGLKVVFAGNNLSSDYHSRLVRLVEAKSCATVVISKSGTTTEPAIAFRLVREILERKYGKQAAERIVTITDAVKGALKTLSNERSYTSFVIPDNVGGRYSVLTPVGLLPIYLAGFDVRKMLEGALEMKKHVYVNEASNPALAYAAARNEFYMNSGKKIELMMSYEPALQYFSEWWKQLFGESEGKEGKGIFPASVVLTTDLHSMGQYIQDGERSLFETIISVGEPGSHLDIPSDAQNLDGLNFLVGKTLDYCNKMAQEGTRLAHEDAGVPNIILELPRIDEYSLGELFYMMEVACGISAYMLGVNPFDQPGVEAYKKNMFALLEKPGYEELRKELMKKLV